MDDLDNLRWIKEFEKEKKQPHLVHTIHPPAGWTNDSECYYLIMDLPDFKKDQVEVIVDPIGNLIIKGARKSGENGHVKFERHFKLPEDSDMTKTVSRKLQNDMLYVTVCKQLVKAPDKFEFESGSSKEEEHETKGVEEKTETEPEPKEEEHADNEKKEAKPEPKEEEHVDNEKKEAKPEPKEKENVDNEKKEAKPEPSKGILKKLADEQKCIWFGILAFAFGVYLASHKLQHPPSK